MTEEKRYILSDFFWEVLDTKYDWLGNTEPFSKEVIEEEDYLLIGRAKTQEDGEKICNLLNKFTEENEELKSKVKKYMEIELLKADDFANCHNCKNNRSVHNGVGLDGMCAIKELMNLDGYFDTEYHKLPKRTICPCWGLEE